MRANKMQTIVLATLSSLLLVQLVAVQSAAAGATDADQPDYEPAGQGQADDKGGDSYKPSDAYKAVGDLYKLPALNGLESGGTKGGTKGDKKGDHLNPLSLFSGGAGGGNIGDWAKLIFNPVELSKAISTHYKLDHDGFVKTIGRHVIYGIEAALTPLVSTLKIIEKVFQPDGCRLKFICKIGNQLLFIKEHVLRFSSNFLEGSHHLRAFSDGIVGKDCEAISKCAGDGLKLKKEYEGLKQDGGSDNYGESVVDSARKLIKLE